MLVKKLFRVTEYRTYIIDVFIMATFSYQRQDYKELHLKSS